MIHVVSGFMRTGTSCMMQALIAGGMTASWSELGERLNDNGDEHYKPNVGGFYELELAEYGTPDWPLQHDGKLVKVISYQRDDHCFVGVNQMEVNPDGYRIVWMFRDTEEIRQSWEASGIGRPFRQELVEDIERQQSACFRQAKNRRDVESVIPLNYRDVVADPLVAFETLAEAGWPISVEKASEAVDPSQCRFRRESLIHGI